MKVQWSGELRRSSRTSVAPEAAFHLPCYVFNSPLKTNSILAVLLYLANHLSRHAHHPVKTHSIVAAQSCQGLLHCLAIYSCSSFQAPPLSINLIRHWIQNLKTAGCLADVSSKCILGGLLNICKGITVDQLLCCCIGICTKEQVDPSCLCRSFPSGLLNTLAKHRGQKHTRHCTDTVQYALALQKRKRGTMCIMLATAF